ncbi:MAG: hypothetical protein LBU22_06970 [Dysgonamonadaceae bacterium]|jgi:hypothetical protein|nr:hypothetical protein [Dysgonamonadaceae bacterium]
MTYIEEKTFSKIDFNHSQLAKGEYEKCYNTKISLKKRIFAQRLLFVKCAYCMKWKAGNY